MLDPIPARPDLELINKMMQIYHLIDFTVPAEHRLEMKKSKKIYLFIMIRKI